MTRDELRDRGTKICERLTCDVAEIAPAGIGHWDRAWDIVAGSDAAFLIALSAWESDPRSEDTKARVKAAYEAVLSAWKQAVAEFEKQRQGTP